MTDHLGHAAEVADPTTSGARLAEIAAARSDLGAAIAMHPNVYDGLLDWLATYGSTDAQAAVARRRTPAPPPPPVPSAPVASAAAAAAASAAAPAATAAARPAPAASVPGSRTPGAPVFSGAAGPRPQGTATVASTPKSRKGLIIGLVAGAAVIVLSVVAGTAAFVLGVFGGSPSPEAAAEKALRGAAGLDPIGIFTSLAPSEVGAMRAVLENVGDVQTSDAEQVDYMQLVQNLKDAGDVTLDGLEFETEQIADGVSAVTLVAGTITIDGDPERVADALVDFTAQTSYSIFDQWGYTPDEVDARLDEQKADLAADLGEQFPIAWDVEEAIADLSDGWSSGSERASDVYPSPFTVVTVDEGGWYVSPMMTTAEIYARQMARWGDRSLASMRGDAVVAAEHFDTPEAAAEGAAAAVESFFVYGDTDELAAVLPRPERRLVSIYGPTVIDPAQFRNWNSPTTVIDPVRVNATIDGDRARIELSDVAISMTDVNGEWSSSMSLNGTCWQYQYASYSYYGSSSDVTGCISDWRPARELGFGDATVVAVRENGGWLISPLATLSEAAVTASERVSQMASEDRLDDLWASQ